MVKDTLSSTEATGSSVEGHVGRRELICTATNLAAASLGAAALGTVGVACGETPEKKIRIAVIGGNFGLQFPFAQHPHCEVTAVSDLRADRLGRLKQAYPKARSYPSLEDLLKKENQIDGVALFTEAPAHAKHVELILKRGLHVLCAVPACMTVEEAERLRELKEKTGLYYMMAETSYYRPATILARQLYSKGAFGKVFYTEADYYHDRGDLQRLVSNKQSRFWEPDGKPSWRQGYPPLLYPTHATGFLVGVTRERLTRVSALGWGSEHPFLKNNAYDNKHWNGCSLMSTDAGHAFRCNVFWLVPDEGERASWMGEHLGLYMQKNGIHPARRRPRPGNAHPVEIPEYWKSDMLPKSLRMRSGHGNSHSFIVAEFINALVQKREPAIDLYESLAMTVPGIVAHQSTINNGEQLKIPSFDPTAKPAQGT